MFLGAIPMALTTVVNAVFDMGARYGVGTAFGVGEILWIANVVIALASGFGIPFWMFTRHEHSLSRMTAVWLMPIVPAEVVAASGSIMLPHLASLALRQDLLVGIMVLWAFSVPMAFLMLGVLFVRLTLHKLPPEDLAISTWISLGTLGTGVMGLVGLSHDVGFAFPQFSVGLGGASLLMALILWGLGLWWMGQSIFITLFYLVAGRLRFNLGWWGLTFPLGVFAGGTDLLDRTLGTGIFLWSSWIFFGMLAVFWVVVALFTVRHLYRLGRRVIGEGADVLAPRNREAS
jgi:tellurite resistance protein TehA-like permease